MKYIQTRDFKPFGYYRMVLGVGIVVFFLLSGSKPGAMREAAPQELAKPRQVERSQAPADSAFGAAPATQGR
jgi:hypothetical protein